MLNLQEIAYGPNFTVIFTVKVAQGLREAQNVT